MQDDARARIFDEYDRRNRKGVYAETTDFDSDDSYLTPAEKRKALDEQLAADESGSALARRKAAEARILATPKPEPVQQYESEEEVLKNYIRARHPGLSDEDWKVMNDDSWIKAVSDIAEHQARALKTGRQEDYDRMVDRAVAERELQKKAAENRAAVLKMGLARDALRSPAR